MSSLQEIQQKLSSQLSSVIAIGNFDGVHLGHRAIMDQLLQISKTSGATPVVLILYPHPREIFTGSSPALLTTLENRKKLIRQLGIEQVFDLTFDFTLSEYTAESILKAFQQSFRMNHLVIGTTTHIGKNRQGTPEKIREIAGVAKFSVSVVGQREIDGKKISSSSIRECIARGEIKMAAKMLGRYYATQGIVNPGMGKGKSIGFPTANLSQIQTLVPVRGVYAGYALIEGQKYKAAINVGTRPTMTSSENLVVEPHLLDFDRSIVGKELEIQWVERIRDEKKFGSIEELKIQIQKDIGKTNDIL